MLNLNLTEEDAKTFGDWTADHVNERLAMVIDGEVVIAPTIQSAITGGEVQITGQVHPVPDPRPAGQDHRAVRSAGARHAGGPCHH